MVVFAEIITNDSLLLVWMSPQTSQREAGFAVSDHIAHREHCPSHAAYDGNSVRFSVRIGRWRLTVEFSAAGACCGMFPKPRLAGNALQIAAPDLFYALVFLLSSFAGPRRRLSNRRR